MKGYTLISCDRGYYLNLSIFNHLDFVVYYIVKQRYIRDFFHFKIIINYIEDIENGFIDISEKEEKEEEY